jgi:hypothetical protein
MWTTNTVFKTPRETLMRLAKETEKQVAAEIAKCSPTKVRKPISAVVLEMEVGEGKSDAQISKEYGIPEKRVKELRKEYGLMRCRKPAVCGPTPDNFVRSLTSGGKQTEK